MKYYHLLILLICILSYSCLGCPTSTHVEYESIRTHSNNGNAPFTSVLLYDYAKPLHRKWSSPKCIIQQDFSSWNNICVNKEKIRICKSGRPLDFNLQAFNEKEEKGDYISNSDYYMNNSSSLDMVIEDRLNFGDSLSIEEYDFPYKGDTIHIDIKLPNYPKEDKIQQGRKRVVK